MIVAVASGKGGTGKTTVATALAIAVASLRQEGCGNNPRVVLMDCDVEEPNAHLYLDPIIDKRQDVGVPTPVVDLEKCNFCRRCSEVCTYHAIAVLGKDVLVFPELCHGCGSCSLNCPCRAITEEMRPIGAIEKGKAGEVIFARGTLNVGEAMAAPVIRQLKKQLVFRQTGPDRSLEASAGSAGGSPAGDRRTEVYPLPPGSIAPSNEAEGDKLLPYVSGLPESRPPAAHRDQIGGASIEAEKDSLVILDAPPGTSCPVVECLQGSDYALMVTEPTPFGLHDLKMAVEVARDKLKLRVGVVINRDGVGDDRVEMYCREEGIPVLMRIPLDRRIAEACSLGLPLPLALPEYQQPFIDLYHRICLETER